MSPFPFVLTSLLVPVKEELDQVIGAQLIVNLEGTLTHINTTITYFIFSEIFTEFFRTKRDKKFDVIEAIP